MQAIDSAEIENPFEQDSLILPAIEDSLPETEILESIVPEDTSAVAGPDSTESAGDVEYGEPTETIDETLPDETLPPEILPPDPQPESEGT